MKTKIFSKIIVVLLIISMVLPLSTFFISAEESSAIDTTFRDRIESVIINQGRTPAEQSEYEEFTRLLKMKEDSSRIEAMFPEKKGFDKESQKKVEDSINNLRKSLPELVNLIKDANDGGDFDTAACVDSVISLVNTVLIFVPYGKIVSSVINLGNTIFKMVMGGEAATSEMAQMEDRLTQQLDEIQNQLSDIEEQINGLSNEINESTNKIISEVTSAIDNADAKAYLRTFMLSGEGNFSYNQYRNYIYGTAKGNSKANTAYYALLKQSIANGASDEITKRYYDQLYTAIMNDREEYYDYIIGSDESKSIVQYYYDVVSARPDLMSERGMSAEYAAVLFAYDIYQTELMANQIIASCNLYQYTQMYLSDTDYYCYDKNTGRIVTLADIDGADGIDSMQEQINIRIDEIQNQLARDIAYILNLDESYIVESADGNLYEVVNSDSDTFGNVLAGQTIYLNRVPEELCDLFDFDANDFTYVVSVPTQIDGAFYVDSNANGIVATLYYNEEEIETISFNVGTNAKFNGGNGTASDPYLIASAAQLARISDGMDKHYRLICDIDFNGETITSIGQRINSNDAVVYDEFVGSLDGNGYKIKNLKIQGNTNAGLFGIIGEEGEVADLKLYNVKVSANITNAEKSVSEFYAGMIAGKNNGVIKYCSVDSDGTVSSGAPIYGLSLNINNATKNRNIYAYAGGIAGANSYVVVGCTVANVHISASSTHNFGGDATTTNKNNVYVGGICGYSSYAIGRCEVKDSTDITSYAKSIYNPKKKVNPYVVAYAGGIVAKVESLDGVFEVQSSAVIVRNEAALDCESKYGEHYNNCSDESHLYIPKISDEDLLKIKATEGVEEFIAKTERDYVVTFECPDTVYEAGSDKFNAENLKLFINGIEREYEIIDIYGFDAQNEKLERVSQKAVVLFVVEIEGERVYLAQEIEITIKENTVTSIEILNLQDSYVKDTFSLEGLVIKFNYIVGNPEYITINSENISQMRYYGNITSFGAQNIALLYNGYTAEFEINVVCGHGNNFTSSESGYVHNESESKAPSCTEIGYMTYVCVTCGDEQHFYLRRTEHTPDYENAKDVIEATCTEDGYTGRICCIDCGETLISGLVIPKLNHNYLYVDENQHACSNGSHTEYHHYTVTESVKSKINADGSEYWYIVYTYTCVCSKNGKTFAKEIVDENTIVDANTKLPTVIVSDGYALSAGDEVVIYVQLLNNPGINAANFGIRYSTGLELVSIQDGNVLKGSLIADGLAVNYGYNFVWANRNLFTEDGNLLKLTFKVSEHAHLGDSYNVSVVYAVANGAQGGFGTSEGKQYFITKDGTIKLVEHLPGDINNDGVVDLMDAIEIGQFVVGKTDSINEMYANVDLSYNKDGSCNVDIMDMVAILQYITGGYGTNLLTQDFEIVLNTNGYDKVLNDLLVSIYGDNNTYDEAGLAELERAGYKFLGWFDKMVGGNLIDLNGTVRYNHNQKKQTLYAHWELNRLIFDDNGATDGVMPDVYYTEDANISVENNYRKEYKVSFVSDKSVYSDITDYLRYQLLYWEGSNGKKYETLDVAVRDLVNEHYGIIALKAVWSESPTIGYPDWLINGYEDDVDWYGSANYSMVTEIKSNEDILNYTPVNGYYMVYAKHTPIVYDIVIDFNGGSGTVGGSSNNSVLQGYSVEKPYELSRVSVSNVGNAFTSWAVYVDGVYYTDFGAGQTIGYLPNVKQGSRITVKAVWNERSYTITYVLNGGNLSESGKITSYRISEIDAMKITSPTYPTYSDYNCFVDWYVDKELTKKFDKSALKTNPDDIVLYAKWSLCNVYSGKIDSVSGNRVIIDWRSVSDFGKHTLYIKNVSEVYILGKSGVTYSNLTISVSGTLEAPNTLICFNNLKMKGVVCQSENSAKMNITFKCEGNNNSITAPDSKVAIYGFGSLTFRGSGSIAITGGNGSAGNNGADKDADLRVNGGNGTNGANGSMAIDCLAVTLYDTVKVTLVGGNGGRGGNGGNVTGAGCFDYQPKLANGGNGGKGGDGGAPLNVSAQIKISSGAQLYMQYGNGGDGGDAGKGGDASWEHNGHKPDGGGDGGVGGQGGSGFVGGNGGDGGKGGYSYANQSGDRNFWGVSAWVTGISGNGGNGGKGGDSISAINCSSGIKTSVNGNVGISGTGGEAGDRGTKDNKHYSEAGTAGVGQGDGTRRTVGYSIIWINNF